jgi:hypothetical protein
MMKKLLPLLALLFFISCEKEGSPNLVLKENIAVNSSERGSADARKSGKIDVCHYDTENDTWHVINVSENAWRGHEGHGDVQLIDVDGDGYVTSENGCGLPVDCDDTDAAINTPVQYYVDNDGDSFGSTVTAMVCSATAPSGYSDNNTDCDDTNPYLNVSCDRDPCLDKAISLVLAEIQGLGGTDANVTITSSNTFLIVWENNGRNGRECIETTAEATEDQETGCGFTNRHHEACS